jgi:hypothetical protein
MTPIDVRVPCAVCTNGPDAHVHQPLPCQNGQDARHHEYVPPKSVTLLIAGQRKRVRLAS